MRSLALFPQSADTEQLRLNSPVSREQPWGFPYGMSILTPRTVIVFMSFSSVLSGVKSAFNPFVPTTPPPLFIDKNNPYVQALVNSAAANITTDRDKAVFKRNRCPLNRFR